MGRRDWELLFRKVRNIFLMENCASQWHSNDALGGPRKKGKVAFCTFDMHTSLVHCIAHTVWSSFTSKSRMCQRNTPRVKVYIDRYKAGLKREFTQYNPVHCGTVLPSLFRRRFFPFVYGYHQGPDYTIPFDSVTSSCLQLQSQTRGLSR